MDRINFVHSTDIEGEKKILQGIINKIFENNCVLIEAISLTTTHEKVTMGRSATVTQGMQSKMLKTLAV